MVYSAFFRGLYLRGGAGSIPASLIQQKGKQVSETQRTERSPRVFLLLLVAELETCLKLRQRQDRGAQVPPTTRRGGLRIQTHRR